MCHTLSSAAAGLHTRTLSPRSEARALPLPACQSRDGVSVTSGVSGGQCGGGAGGGAGGEAAEGVLS